MYLLLSHISFITEIHLKDNTSFKDNSCLLGDARGRNHICCDIAAMFSPLIIMLYLYYYESVSMHIFVTDGSYVTNTIPVVIPTRAKKGQ